MSALCSAWLWLHWGIWHWHPCLFPHFCLVGGHVQGLSSCIQDIRPLRPLDTLHYVQPCCTSSLYPFKIASHVAAKSPAIIEDDSSQAESSDAFIWSYPQSKCVSSNQHSPPVLVAATPFMSAPSADLESVSAQLCSLADTVSSPMPPTLTTSLTSKATDRGSRSSHVLLSTITHDKIVSLLHHDHTSLPSVCHYNTDNASDTKTHWSAEELHRIMGCCKFCNYKSILQISCNGEWINGGGLPPPLGSFATIVKAKCDLPLDCTLYPYLDGVHMVLPFATASLLAVFAMPSSLSSIPPTTIGRLA